MFAVQRLRGTEVHRNAMLHNAIPVENLIENLQCTAAIDHVVLGNDLKPIDDRLLRKDMVVVRHPQSDAYAIVGKPVETICRHDPVLNW